jgi:flavin-dependent dehydrogenase
LNAPRETDVLVVGAGPGGSAAAYHLARHGVDVTVVEKARFPREKVCGDGLTPRSVAALIAMGIDPATPGFEKVIGLRVHSRGAPIELRWPELNSFPGYGLAMTRNDLDAMLAERAQKAGAALLERTEAVSPIMRDETRPLGIAARRYYHTSYHPGPWFESWLDLWEGDLLLPGYGWLFPVAGGRINLGAGLLNTFKDFEQISAQRLFSAFATMMPPDWEIDEAHAEGRVLSGPLPMGLNRVPQAVPGMLLIGDAAGAVNPFNGEGIAYAIETGEMAAELVHEALAKDRPAIAMMYPAEVRERYGRYFKIGRGFARVIGKPAVMGGATKYLLPNEGIMGFAMRVMANLTDGKDGDAQDRLFYLIERLMKAT